MLLIKIKTFELITGIDLTHFTNYILKGDNWGSFLKIAIIIEASSKRAICFKNNIPLDSKASRKMEFCSSLVKCKKMKLITDEAFFFADYIRNVRNDLVHKGGALNLDIEKMRGNCFYNKYKENVDNFIKVEGQDIRDGQKEHFNILIFGCLAFVGIIAKELYNEDWFTVAKS